MSYPINTFTLIKLFSVFSRKRTRLRRAMISFPAAPPTLPVKRGKDFRVTPDTVQLGKKSRLSVGIPKDMSGALELSLLHRRLDLMLSNTPINMSMALTSALADDNNG